MKIDVINQKFKAEHPDFGVTYFTLLDIYELGTRDGQREVAIAFGRDNVYLRDCEVTIE